MSWKNWKAILRKTIWSVNFAITNKVDKGFPHYDKLVKLLNP